MHATAARCGQHVRDGLRRRRARDSRREVWRECRGCRKAQTFQRGGGGGGRSGRRRDGFAMMARRDSPSDSARSSSHHVAVDESPRERVAADEGVCADRVWRALSVLCAFGKKGEMYPCVFWFFLDGWI